MVGLREKVERGHALKGIAGGDQQRQVTRQCGGVAGDVDDLCWLSLDQPRKGIRVKPGTRRVDENKIGFDLQRWQDLFDRAYIERNMVILAPG